MTKFEMNHHLIFKFKLSAASTSALQLKVEASGQEDQTQQSNITDSCEKVASAFQKKAANGFVKEKISFRFSSSTLRNHIFQLQ